MTTFAELFLGTVWYSGSYKALKERYMSINGEATDDSSGTKLLKKVPSNDDSEVDDTTSSTSTSSKESKKPPKSLPGEISLIELLVELTKVEEIPKKLLELIKMQRESEEEKGKKLARRVNKKRKREEEEDTEEEKRCGTEDVVPNKRARKRFEDPQVVKWLRENGLEDIEEEFSLGRIRYYQIFSGDIDMDVMKELGVPIGSRLLFFKVLENQKRQKDEEQDEEESS